MNPELVQLFRDALDLAPAERCAFLDSACSDSELRAQIDLLLQASEQSEPLLPNVFDLIARSATTSRELPDRAGQIVGPFRLTHLLGSGGMGTVWQAERVDGFAQTVAIKWAHAAGLSSMSLARFSLERQLLAKLNHPGIARVVDGGVGDGALWFAMEYVDGMSLDHFVTARQPSLNARIQLLIDLCAAVQFAHQNLVVHRDLKPANIMVQPNGCPKLLDFGVAKQLDQLEPITMSRAPMSFAYAAPEQIRGDAITTATDIYALGVILFELLTGERPHKPVNRPGGDASLSLLQAITDTDATAPSLVLSQATEAHTGFRAAQLKGDLDTIVLKALSRDPARRYASAQALAEDLQCYLDGQPISARKESRGYRLAKFVRRNRLASSALVLAVVAMLGGTTVALIQRQHAVTQRKVAEQNASNALAAKNFVIRVFTGANRWTTGRDVSALELAHRGFLEVEGQLKGQPEAQLELYTTLAAVFGRNSPMSWAVAASEKRLALMPQMPQLPRAQRVQIEIDHAVFLFWAERANVAEQIAHIRLNYPAELAADPPKALALLDLERQLLRFQQHYAAFRKLATPAAMQAQVDAIPGNTSIAHFFHSLLVQTDFDEVRFEQGYRRMGPFADTAETMSVNDPTRALATSLAATLLLELAPSPQIQAIQTRGLGWCALYFGEDSTYCDNYRALQLRSALYQGRYAEAAVLYERSFAINNRYPDEAVFELQPLIYRGALLALVQGDRALAESRVDLALRVGLKMCGEQGSCVRSATALKLWLARTPEALRELRRLSETQLAQDESEAWRSLMWLAQSALDANDVERAKTDLAKISGWLKARGAGPAAELVTVYARANMKPPVMPAYDVDVFAQRLERWTTVGERLQQQRAVLPPISATDIQ